MTKGRPPKSKVRERIATILQHTRNSYGYEIYKIYKQLYGGIKMRTLYYNLRKGVILNEFIISNITREAGDYTWGHETERVYYINGPYAEPERIEITQQKKLERVKQKMEIINHEEQLDKIMEELQKEINIYIAEFKILPVNKRTKKYQEINGKLQKLNKWANTNEIKNGTIKEQIRELQRNIKAYEY